MTHFHYPFNRFTAHRSPVTAMDHALYILPLLLTLLFHRAALTSAADAGQSPMMLPSPACTDELVVFSSCLPFIGASPNNRTDFPPQECCDDVSKAFTNGSAICFCYLILEPDILGFPLNSSKLLSLTSFCPRNDQNSTASFSLQTLCSGSAALPPLHSISGSNKPKPQNTGKMLQSDFAESPPPQESSDGPSTEQPADVLPNEARSSTRSSALQKICWLRWTQEL
ncbi:non-specific lipid transfer protein GPI-anchored 25 [Salvia miltiorrhiza]|uniref:non-specific lipid transfer protein GPI-anchored 25 n=1 Tax=Salvia miltiorrhiza TaxID=226208 RepID=UPI0025ABE0A7|nr:non-specific lipid transfer protein GPI-anchored 25 [Salvia miltiorrhiza]